MPDRWVCLCTILAYTTNEQTFCHITAKWKTVSFNIPKARVWSVVLYCGRVPASSAPGRTAAEGLLYKPWSLVFPTCTARCLHQRP